MFLSEYIIALHNFKNVAGSQRRTSSTVVPMQNKSRFLRAGKTVAMSLRFADSVATEKRVEEEDVEEVEEVELDGSADDEENIDELRGFMFEMLKNLLCDVVVGKDRPAFDFLSFIEN